MKTFKVKINGRKCKVILMNGDDIIDKFTWYTHDVDINSNTSWFLSKAQGDKISKRPNRLYIRNCSPMYGIKI